MAYARACAATLGRGGSCCCAPASVSKCARGGALCRRARGRGHAQGAVPCSSSATTRSSRATGTSARALSGPASANYAGPNVVHHGHPGLMNSVYEHDPGTVVINYGDPLFARSSGSRPRSRAGARDPSGVLPAAYSSWLLCSIRHIPWSRDHPRRVSNAGPPHARPDLYARRLAFRSSLKAHAGVRVVQVDYLRGSVAMTASTAP